MSILIAGPFMLALKFLLKTKADFSSKSLAPNSQSFMIVAKLRIQLSLKLYCLSHIHLSYSRTVD